MTSAEGMAKVIRQEYGLSDRKVLSAMLRVPREKFVPPHLANQAYEDKALPIGNGQTISQPYTVAFMTHLLNLEGDERVLEIGTGSGYQAAILSELAKKVYTVEKIGELAEVAKKRLKHLGFKNVLVKVGSGDKPVKRGLLFDRVIVTAAIPDEIPKILFDQLKIGGILVAPLGRYSQKMLRFTKTKRGLKKEEFGSFQFVPFVESK